MPGPSNKRRQKKTQAKREKGRRRSSVAKVSEGDNANEESQQRVEEGIVEIEEAPTLAVHRRPLPQPPTSTTAQDQLTSDASLSISPSSGASPSPSFSMTPPSQSPSPSTLSKSSFHSIPFDSWDLSNSYSPAPPYILSDNSISEKDAASPEHEPQDEIFYRLSNPIIHDPGNGPRVLSAREFIDSSFAQPACTSDPLRAEFAQPEVLQMLRTVLPEETAIVRSTVSRRGCLRTWMVIEVAFIVRLV